MPTPGDPSVFASSTYATALAEWRRSPDPEERVLAINLDCEHRVPPQQEQEFRRFFDPPAEPAEHGRALKAALISYANEMVRPGLPARRLGVNLVADCAAGACCEGFDLNCELVNVLNLNQLQRVLLVAGGSDRSEWSPISDVKPAPHYDAWLDGKLRHKSPHSTEVKSFVEAVFSVLRYFRTKFGSYNPTWVTTWDKFAPYVEALKAGEMSGVDRWNQVVGVGTTGEQWQVVLKYPARKAGLIFRPTQLDGGFYAYHFPSPAAASIGLGGHPMDLSGPAPTESLLPEYIHEQIEPDIRYWVNAGRLLGCTAAARYELTTLRLRHYERLKSHYEGVAEWMPSPV